MLIEDLTKLNDHAMIRLLGEFALLLDGNPHPKRIPDKNWFDKAQSVVAVGKSLRVDFPGCHAEGYAKRERPLSDTLLEFRGLAPLSIHMVRVEIANVHRMKHNVGFSDGSSH